MHSMKKLDHGALRCGWYIKVEITRILPQFTSEFWNTSSALFRKMKYLVVLSAVLAFAAGKPQILAPVAYAAGPVISPIIAPVAVAAPVVSSQFHAQDELGQYSYGYASPLSAKTEVKTADGITRGGYSYVDAEGKLQTAEYVSDALGFRVAASNLPVPVVAPVAPILESPKPVVETVDVVKAKVAHMAAHEEAKARLAVAEKVVEVVETPAVETPVVAAPAVIAAPAPLAAVRLAAPSIAAPLPIGFAASPFITGYSAPLGIAAPWGAPLAWTSPIFPIDAKMAKMMELKELKEIKELKEFKDLKEMKEMKL